MTPVPIVSEELLNLGSQEQHVIVDLAVALLRGYFNNPKVNASNWEHYLKKIFNILHVGREGLRSPFVVDTFDSEGRRIEKELSFNDLSLRDRADVIYHLCEYRLYADDASDAAGILVEDELRIEPIGTDSKGNVYWYFYGTRLYRENPEATKKVENRLTALKRYKEYFGREEQKKTTKDSSTSKSSATCENNKQIQQLKSSIPAERSSSRKSKPVDRLNGETLRNSHYKRPKLEEQTTTKQKNNNKSSSKKSSSSTDFDSIAGPDPNTSCGVALSDLQAAWICVCSTESEWESLVESLKKSKVPCEIELHQLLSENFLPQIKELFAEVERARAKEEKQKLLEFLPRRTSSRIELKKIQQEEEEKKAEEAREGERRRRAQAEERRKVEEERRRKEAVQREREERARQRQAVMEDRAARAALRARDKSKNTFNDKNGDVSDDDIDLSDASVSLVTSNGWPLSE